MTGSPTIGAGEQPEAASKPRRRVLVTGAAGFIGFHIARRLARDGALVLGVDNLGGDGEELALKQARLGRLDAEPNVAFERLDLTRSETFEARMAAFAPGEVIHLAAQAGVRRSIDRPASYVASNVAGTLTVLEACRRHPVDHLIYASSSSVYGTARPPFSEHDPADHPVSLYAATKRSAELMAHAYAHLFGLPATGLRFFTVYGPWGRPDMAAFAFTRAIAEGRPIDVYNEGRMERDFTYIDDVVEAIARLIDRPPTPNPAFDPLRPDPASAAAPHRIYNIGNNAPVPLDRFICAIEAAVGAPATRRLLPMQPGDVPSTCADIADLAAAIGFSPSISIEEGMRRFVAWYRDFYDA